ncbi:MAG: RidA family protein [Gemmatimonadaceae bacterium]|nr:RidA family protein [Gemmatimonadaceae bacterium]
MHRSTFSSIRRAAVIAAVIALGAAPARAQAREAIGPPSPILSQAIRVGNMVYAAGQLPSRGTDTTIQAQTRSTLENIKRVFESAGTTMAHATKCTVFIIDGADFAGMNEVYRTFWTSAPPARTTVIVKGLVVPGAKLEIECNAAMPTP